MRASVNNYAYGNFLSDLRNQKGLRSYIAAELSGMVREEYSRLENGRFSPRVDVVVALWRALGGDLAEHLRLSGSVPPEVLALLQKSPDSVLA